MSIRMKLLMMVGLPVAAIIIIFGVGLSSFYVIDFDTTEMNMLHMDRATMIDADRDAYQAQLAVMHALEAEEGGALSKAREDSVENMQQTWDRIEGPAEHFTPEMGNAFQSFKTSFVIWKKDNDQLLKVSAETLAANRE